MVSGPLTIGEMCHAPGYSNGAGAFFSCSRKVHKISVERLDHAIREVGAPINRRKKMN